MLSGIAFLFTHFTKKLFKPLLKLPGRIPDNGIKFGKQIMIKVFGIQYFIIHNKEVFFRIVIAPVGVK